MIKRNCLKCGKKFITNIHALKVGKGKFCSVKCSSKKGNIQYQCITCHDYTTCKKVELNRNLGCDYYITERDYNDIKKHEKLMDEKESLFIMKFIKFFKLK